MPGGRPGINHLGFPRDDDAVARRHGRDDARGRPPGARGAASDRADRGAASRSRRGARPGRRLRRLPHRPARDQGGGRVPDPGRARARDLRHGGRARRGRRRSRRRLDGDRHVHHAVRRVRGLPPGPRRPLREVLRPQPPAGNPLRRHDPALPPRRNPARHVLDGWARRVRSAPGDGSLSAARQRRRSTRERSSAALR